MEPGCCLRLLHIRQETETTVPKGTNLSILGAEPHASKTGKDPSHSHHPCCFKYLNIQQSVEAI